MYRAITGIELIAAFSDIATNYNVSGTLADRFPESLSEEISARIMVD